MLSKSKQQRKGYTVKYKGTESFSEERAELLERRKQLSGELTSTLTTIGHVDRDLERLHRDVLATGMPPHFHQCKFVAIL